MSDDPMSIAPSATVVSYEEFSAWRQRRDDRNDVGGGQSETWSQEDLDLGEAIYVVEEILACTDSTIERLASGIEEYLSGSIDVKKEVLRKLILLIDFITDSPRKRVAGYLQTCFAGKDIGDIDLDEVAGTIAYDL